MSLFHRKVRPVLCGSRAEAGQQSRNGTKVEQEWGGSRGGEQEEDGDRSLSYTGGPRGCPG